MIRNAKPDDLHAVLDIWNRAIRETVATFSSEEKTLDGLSQMLADRQANNDAFIVAEMDRKILGFASYKQFRVGNGYRFTFENTIYLNHEATGKGIGRNMLLWLEDHARDRGGHSMIAGVTASNTAAVAFHKRLGYADTALLPRVGYKFGQWHDLLLMQKLLSHPDSAQT